MIFENEQQAISYIKANQKPSTIFQEAREQSKTLTALIEGDYFADELINNIEHLESYEKAKARKKYSRSVVDFFEQLLSPISNVFNSTGGSKIYDIENEELKSRYLKQVSYLKNGKSVSNFVEDKWMQLYHIDPNGVIFMEYDSIKEIVYPTYKSINSIRSYEAKGQLVDVILFEPEKTKDGQLYRIVDDIHDWFFLERGGSYQFVEEISFEHPFGEVPAIINSNIEKVNKPIKLSPINKIVELAKEYARDQSIKTIYKFLQGFPIHWRYVSQCRSCQGTGKKGNDICTDCDGKGFYQKKDVTDMVTLPIPKFDNEPTIAPNIAGYISPDLATWEKYTEELEYLNMIAHKTIWGTHIEQSKNETATGRFIDIQPVINRLNKYADVAEFVEWKLSEWVYRYVNPTASENIASIQYGRRYIIESPNVILEQYEEAKAKGDNNVILDRMLNEYITSKYKNSPVQLREELLKAKVEPYIHLSIEQINSIFGSTEASRKEMFSDWWMIEADKSKDAQDLIADYKTYFNNLNIQSNESNGSS